MLSPESSTTTPWSIETACNSVFKNKFVGCVDIFKQWLDDRLDLSQSTILDFGCGDGVMALGMALQLQPKRVIGVEITQDFNVLPGMAKSQIGLEALPANLELHLVKPNEKLAGRFQSDCVFSWSVFEHVAQDYLDPVVDDLRNVIRDGGFAFVQIAPLYFSADGGHLFELSPKPWAHLSVQFYRLKHQVLTATKRPAAGQLLTPQDEAHYQRFKEAVWTCFEKLNKLTADDVIALYERHGFRLIRQHRTECAAEPGEELTRIYNRDVLKTEQIVALFQKI